MGMPAKTWPVTVSASLKTRRKWRKTRPEDDVLSSVWIVESDFEPAGKGAEDGVFGDAHDVSCSDERVGWDEETCIMDTYRSCPGRASGYRSSSLERVSVPGSEEKGALLTLWGDVLDADRGRRRGRRRHRHDE